MGRPIGGPLGRPMAIKKEKKERKERKKVNKVCICIAFVDAFAMQGKERRVK
jgi:hypothetical protein